MLRADITFLERLGEELTRPVLPQGAVIDYVPSQYLCEFIKKCGYDGVIYRSSASDGINLALFDPSKATGGAVALYNITRVSVTVAAAFSDVPSQAGLKRFLKAVIDKGQNETVLAGGGRAPN